MTDTADTAPARAELRALADAPPVQQAADLVRRNHPNFVALLGSDEAAKQFQTAFMTEFRRSPELQECDPYSVVGGMRQAAQLGLSFGPQGFVYLVPRKLKGRWWATFVLGYTGILELARQGGAQGLRATVVWSDEEWSGIKNVNGSFRYTHTPRFDHENDAERIGVLVEWTDGAKQALLVPPAEIDKALKASALTDTSRRNEDWYWKKTAVRRARPWLPQSPKLALADAMDEQDAEPLDELPADDA